MDPSPNWKLAALGLSLVALCISQASNQRSGHGIDIAGMDRTVPVKSPFDLYNFANGTWFDRTGIPADKSYVGTFEEVEERNLATLKSIAEKASHRSSSLSSTPTALVGGLYGLAMDDKRLEATDAAPILAELHRIDLIENRTSLVSEIGRLNALSVSASFQVSVQPDGKNASRMLLTLSQGRLILPERGLYLDDDERSKAIRAQYLITIGRLMELAKVPGAAEKAKEALDLEIILAKASSTAVELRSAAANYHLTSSDELARLAPSVRWTSYFKGLGTTIPPSVDVAQPKFVEAFSKALDQAPISMWRSYLRAAVLYAWSPFLSNRFVKTQASLAGDITGSTQMPPRWKRALQTIDSVLGGAMGQIFVAKAFSPDAKATALKLVRTIKAAYRDRIRDLDWMSTETQAQAIKKLDAMAIRVGYPDQPDDYSGLSFRGNSYLQSVLKATGFRWRRQIAKLAEPVDRSEWTISAASLKPFYDPHRNELIVPAGLLQPGLFDIQADDASNYGAVGALIGHEMTHGFDLNGSQFDYQGNLANWWTKDDRELYGESAANIERQYNAYKSPEDIPVNGRLTLDENIADIGGLTLAYLAYHRALGSASPPVRDGLAGDQRFFVAFAQNYRSHYRPDVAKVIVSTDPYSPEPVRVVGAASDQPAFYKAFGLVTPKYVPHLW